MPGSKKNKTIIMICPYCKTSFMKSIKNYRSKTGLSSLLVKNHPRSQKCPPFVAFIDKNGEHRGSQKIDDIGDIDEIEKKVSVNSEIFENARNSINELENVLKFYHLKVERKGMHGENGFEHKVADEKDKEFMKSSFYKNLIEFLSENKDQSTFGIIDNEGDHEFEGGSLIYGKYLGIIFTLFWKDQAFLQNKTLEALKSYANLTVEQLIDTYDLVDFFF
jgi:hypothetical protein